MAYKEKNTKKWWEQWFETTAKGEKKKRRKRGFETKRGFVMDFFVFVIFFTNFPLNHIF